MEKRMGKYISNNFLIQHWKLSWRGTKFGSLEKILKPPLFTIWISIKIKKANGKQTLCLLYEIGVGHFLGFLSWTPLQTFVYSGNSSSVFYNLGAQVIISAVLGFLFAKIQLRISEKI